jgi:hypothetical protein
MPVKNVYTMNLLLEFKPGIDFVALSETLLL